MSGACALRLPGRYDSEDLCEVLRYSAFSVVLTPGVLSLPNEMAVRSAFGLLTEVSTLSVCGANNLSVDVTLSMSHRNGRGPSSS